MIMECQHFAEIMPWLLNGSLEVSEQSQAQSHLAQCPTCQQQWRETLSAATVYQQHLAPESLVDYAWDRPLLAGQRELIEQHLAFCRECAEEMEMTRASRSLLAEEPEVNKPVSTGAEIRPFVQPEVLPSSVRLWKYTTLAAGIAGLLALGALLWNSRQHQSQVAQFSETQRTLNERLNSAEAEAQRLREMHKASPSPLPSPSLPEPEAIARLQQEVTRLQSQLKDLASSGINTPVVEMFPDEFTQRSGSAPQNRLTLPRGARIITLILNSQNSRQGSFLEILDAQNRIVWSAEGLRRNATDDYTLTLPAEILSPGEYAINVFEKKGSRREKVESWKVQVTRSGAK
jgi:anti-sigma factor RsiW